MKKILYIIILLQACSGSQCPGGDCDQEGNKIVDVGNKSCPVSGDTVVEGYSYVYKGKRYGLCGSGACVKPFAQNPDLHASKAEQDTAGTIK